MHAAWAGKLEVVRYLVSAGASRDAEDNEVNFRHEPSQFIAHFA